MLRAQHVGVVVQVALVEHSRGHGQPLPPAHLVGEPPDHIREAGGLAAAGLHGAALAVPELVQQLLGGAEVQRVGLVGDRGQQHQVQRQAQQFQLDGRQTGRIHAHGLNRTGHLVLGEFRDREGLGRPIDGHQAAQVVVVVEIELAAGQEHPELREGGRLAEEVRRGAEALRHATGGEPDSVELVDHEQRRAVPCCGPQGRDRRDVEAEALPEFGRRRKRLDPVEPQRQDRPPTRLELPDGLPEDAALAGAGGPSGQHHLARAGQELGQIAGLGTGDNGLQQVAGHAGCPTVGHAADRGAVRHTG